MAGESYIQIKNISKSFGRHTVLKNVSFDIKKGEIFGILGSSGSGKTTLLSILIGFLSPDTGKVYIATKKKSHHKHHDKHHTLGSKHKAKSLGSKTQKLYDKNEIDILVEEIQSINSRLEQIEKYIHSSKPINASELNEGFANVKHDIKLKLNDIENKLGKNNINLGINETKTDITVDKTGSSSNPANNLHSITNGSGNNVEGGTAAITASIKGNASAINNSENSMNPEHIKYVSIFSNILKVRRVFGFSAQEPSFYGKLTVKENLKYYSQMFDIPEKIRNLNIRTLLTFLDLRDVRNTLADNLSGGMQKRLDIACALINNPKVLILDEPTADLDPELRKQILDLIKRINQNGTTVIIASHFLEELEKICGRVAILDNGQVIELGIPSEIIAKHDLNYVIRIKALKDNSNNIAKLKSSLDKMKSIYNYDVFVGNEEFLVYTKNVEDFLQNITVIIKTNKIKIDKINVESPNLRLVFEKIIREKYKDKLEFKRKMMNQSIGKDKHKSSKQIRL